MTWFVTEPRTYMKEKRKRRQWVRPWIRRRDSKGAYYSIINDLRLTDKENFSKKISEKPLAATPILLFCLNKNQNYVFSLFSYCINGHCLSKSSSQLMLLSVSASCISENKRTHSAQVRLYCVLLKKLFLYNE